MDEILDACALELLAACGCACNHEEGFSCELFIGRNCILCVFVVARTYNHDVRFGLYGGLDAFVYCCEAQIVDNLVTGNSEEVARELCSCLTHRKVSDGQHEGFGTAAALLDLHAQCLELLGQTALGKHVGLFTLFCAAAALFLYGAVAVCCLVEVGVLVGSEQNLLATGCSCAAALAVVVYALLNAAALNCLTESALVLDGEEQFPSLACECRGELLNKVRACGGVGHSVKMALVLEDNLLVAGDALGKGSGRLVHSVEGGDGD